MDDADAIAILLDDTNAAYKALTEPSGELEALHAAETMMSPEADQVRVIASTVRYLHENGRDHVLMHAIATRIQRL
jgi:hypothetical protein